MKICIINYKRIFREKKTQEFAKGFLNKFPKRNRKIKFQILKIYKRIYEGVAEETFKQIIETIATDFAETFPDKFKKITIEEVL